MDHSDPPLVLHAQMVRPGRLLAPAEALLVDYREPTVADLRLQAQQQAERLVHAGTASSLRELVHALL